jgi:predicted transglutaminase-like cysteine proteinase
MVLRILISAALAIVGATLFSNVTDARPKSAQDRIKLEPIVEASPTLAPFQHVRFCLTYPSDCKSDTAQFERIEMDSANSELIQRVNRIVNAAITPAQKLYGSDLKDGWSIAPEFGDCNDYAVTKRHKLIESGLPARALRLSVVQTASRIGHLVLVVSTTQGDVVLDNLTTAIRDWQSTDYRWLKIQSTNDARYWYAVEKQAASVALPTVSRKLRLALQKPDA